MNLGTRTAAIALAAILFVMGVEASAQMPVWVVAGSTNSTTQTIGNSGSLAITSYTMYWNFGTSPGPSNLNPTSNSAASTITANSLLVTGSSVVGPISGTNASTGYSLGSGTNASGGLNWGMGMTTPYPVVSSSSSPSFKITLNSPPTPPTPSPPTPGANYIFDISSVQFGSRSAATGPTKISLRYNYDDFQQDLASTTVSANGAWQAVNMSPSMILSPTRTIGLFGMNGSGTATPMTPNWQIDDLRLAGSLYTFTGGSMSSQTYSGSGAGISTMSGNFTITGTATFSGQAGNTLNVTGVIGGYGTTLQKNGSGLLVLSNSNSYVGSTVITAGTVQAGNAYAFGSGPIAVNDGATLDLNGLAIANRIVNRGAATILNAQNFTGAQTISSGTVTFASMMSGSMTIAPGSQAMFNGGFSGKAELSGSAAFGGTMSGGVSLLGSGSASFSNLVSGSVGLSGSDSKAFFSNLITGTVVPSDGAVSVITGTVNPSASVQVGQGGKMQFGNGLNFQQPALPNQGLVEMTNSGSIGLATSITGTGGFAMAGGGLTSLSGSSSFTGGTTVSSGSLQASNPNALGQGGVDVGSGATFVLATDLILGGSNGIKLNAGSQLQSQDGASAPIAANSALGGVTMSGSVSSSSSPATAALLAGLASGSGGMLATQWTSAGKPSTAVSDILDLTTPTGSSAFVLSMNYDPASENANLWLGWNSGSNGWINSVDGNTGNNALAAQQGFLGSFTAFQGAYGTNLSNYIGAYGRDNATDTVWAVVNHNSEFVALVPEPGTVVLAVGAVVTIAAVRQRRSSRRR